MTLSIRSIGNQIASRYYVSDQMSDAVQFGKKFGATNILWHNDSGQWILFLNTHEYEDYLSENARNASVVRVG